VPLVCVFYSCFSRLTCLSNADLTTLTGYTIHNWNLQSQVVLLSARKLEILVAQQRNVVSVQHPTNVTEVIQM